MKKTRIEKGKTNAAKCEQLLNHESLGEPNKYSLCYFCNFSVVLKILKSWKKNDKNQNKV